jgi:site-specific DNA-methyltransferase (adenine-specific)
MNHLYYGDNLTVLRDHIATESVDLIYLDPPFNSNASYNVLFKQGDGAQSAAQIEAFDDTWHWNDSAEAAFGEVVRGGNAAASTMLRAMRSFLGDNDMMAYLAMMAVRLVELHRVLKPTGSLYLHCDPTASHYLKILLDAVFGAKSYRNEIVWRRATSHNDAKRFGRITDRIYYYTKSDEYLWNGDHVRSERSKEDLDRSYPSTDKRGRFRSSDLTGPSHGQSSGESAKPWKGYDVISRGRVWSAPLTGKYAEFIEREFIPAYRAISGVHARLDALDDAGLILHPKAGFWPGIKRYSDADLGNPIQDLILDPIGFTNFSSGNESLGYPTQKPAALLEKFVAASSNPGDVVLDPFCGCGTTVHAAQKLGRRWIGIDVTHLAVGLIEKRLRDAFPGVQFTTHGVPQDIDSARNLAARGREDKNYYFEFEKWALSLINAQPGNLSKKGADKGIDGNLYFGAKSEGRAIVSVKAGDNVGVAMIRDLRGVIEREGAQIGVFLTLTEPSRPMLTEAAGAGQYEAPGLAGAVPRIQIVTIEQALALRDRAVRLPAIRQDGFKRAAKEEDATRQSAMDL